MFTKIFILNQLLQFRTPPRAEKKNVWTRARTRKKYSCKQVRVTLTPVPALVLAPTTTALTHAPPWVVLLNVRGPTAPRCSAHGLLVAVFPFSKNPLRNKRNFKHIDLVQPAPCPTPRHLLPQYFD